MNERFGTSFARFDDAADNVEAVFEIIEERARRPAWQHMLGEFLAGRLSWDEYQLATRDLRVGTPPPRFPSTGCSDHRPHASVPSKP